MKTSKDVTVTDARMKEVLRNQINPIISETVPPMIEKSLNNVRIYTGVVTKFYHYLNKVEVKLDDDGRKVVCKRLHLLGGNLIDLFTPTADHQSFCDTLKEPCIIPRDTLHCLVVNIFNNTDFLFLGFFEVEELVGLNPAAPGNLKICAIGGTNQYWIKFGHDGLDIRTNREPTTKVGDMDDDMTDVVYANSDEVYTKEESYNKGEVYNKEEVDERINPAVTVDSSLSDTSTNPVQNKVINTALQCKVDKETGKGLFSGNYNDLSNKPSIPSDVNELSDNSGIIPSDVSDLTDNQNTQFTPKIHEHTVNNITDFPNIPKIYYGTCSTGASTRVKEVTTSSDYTLTTGTVLIVKFDNNQTYNASAENPVQLKVNNADGVDVVLAGTTKTVRYHWKSGETVAFVYDGTNYALLDDGLATTTYYGVTKLSDSVSSTSTSLAATPNAVKTAYDLANPSYTLRQTITENDTTIKVYSNNMNVYIKYDGTPALTANTNYTFGTAIDSDYRPASGYEYGLIDHVDANIFGAVNANGNIYIVNKTGATSATVLGSIMYPLKSTLP